MGGGPGMSLKTMTLWALFVSCPWGGLAAAAPSSVESPGFRQPCWTHLLKPGPLHLFFLKNFLKFSPLELAELSLVVFPELKWLTKNVVVSPENTALLPHPAALSVKLFGQLYPEFDRTLGTLTSLQQILRGDY